MNINLIFIMFCIFALGAASGYFSERVGIVNIGINGMMIFGAMMFSIFGGLMNPAGKGNDNLFIVALLLAALSTTIFGVFFGFSTIVLKTDHVIAGTAINLLGAGLGLLFTNILGPLIFGAAATELRNAFPYLWLIDQKIGLYGSVLLTALIVIIILIVFMVIFKFHRFGLRYKSIGENPNASDSQGINVKKYQWIGVIISSILAGLAGAIFMTRTGGSTPFFGEVDGLGFMALAIMITGSWKLPLIVIVSIIFSLLYSFSEVKNDNVDSNLIKLIPYILTLVFLVIFSKWMRGPKFAGQHFDKSRR